MKTLFGYCLNLIILGLAVFGALADPGTILNNFGKFLSWVLPICSFIFFGLAMIGSIFGQKEFINAVTKTIELKKSTPKKMFNQFKWIGFRSKFYLL